MSKMDSTGQTSGVKTTYLCKNNSKSSLRKNKRTSEEVLDLGTQVKKPKKSKISSKDEEIKHKDKEKVKKLSATKIKKSEANSNKEILEKKKVSTEIQYVAVMPSQKNTSIFNWTDEEYLAANENLSVDIARNIIHLFEGNNTIPFIARYRSDLTGNLKADKLRKIRATFDYVQAVHKKAQQLIHQIPSTTAPDLLECIKTTQTLEELEFIGSQFKKNSKRSLADRAKKLGLEVPAKEILEGKLVNFNTLINPNEPGLEDNEKIKLGIQHIIADIISKNSDVRAFLEGIYSSDSVLLSSKFKVVKNKTEQAESKYHLYGNFSQPLTAIQPHQTLAINRGESEKELVVKIVIPDFLWKRLKVFCKNKWLQLGSLYESLFDASLCDAIKRLLRPLAVRRIRAKLNNKAESEALHTFGLNLKQLLMTRPCEGHIVMGVDPGFSNGCKVAVVSRTGTLLAHDKFFLKNPVEAKKKLKSLVFDHGCDIIALGNGVACRETENLLSDLINKKTFSPFNVSYTIISEQGVSIYSCSSTAQEEFPDLDPKIVSAISLARRLQNPLDELVKVEPKHLGVGMYQHDVREKKLVAALNDVVSECVSFVGVDINTASLYLLRRIAGLSTSKAQKIIKYRTENCSFKSREDLKKVKGISAEIFRQCAGFIRVIPSTARCTKHEFCQTQFNKLDETSIHPESYEAANRIIEYFKLNLNQLGSEEFIESISKQVKLVKMEKLASLMGCSPLSAEFIINTIMKPKNFDLRSLSAGPIFRKEVKKLEELLPGQTIEGVVRNVVTFGAFVDIGVGKNGLIHKSQIRNNTLSLNDKVKVEVISINLITQRIELKLLSLIK